MPLTAARHPTRRAISPPLRVFWVNQLIKLPSRATLPHCFSNSNVQFRAQRSLGWQGRFACRRYHCWSNAMASRPASGRRIKREYVQCFQRSYQVASSLGTAAAGGAVPSHSKRWGLSTGVAGLFVYTIPELSCRKVAGRAAFGEITWQTVAEQNAKASCLFIVGVRAFLEQVLAFSVLRTQLANINAGADRPPVFQVSNLAIHQFFAASRVDTLRAPRLRAPSA